MKQIIRYISVVVLLMFSTVAFARGGEEVKVEIATLTNGTITSSVEGQTCTLTVTPTAGYYIRKDDITVQKTVNPGAITRGDINFADKLSLKGDDPAALSAARTYTFDIPEGYNAYVTASFTACTKISLSVSMSDWTFGSEASSPSVTGNTGNATVTYSYATKGSTEFAADKPVNAGEYTVKAAVPAIGIYTAGEATANFTISAKAEPDNPDTPDTPVEPNPEVVNPENMVTVGDKVFYEPTDETKEVLKENFGADIALSAEAANSVTMNSDGEMQFKEGQNVNIALHDQKAGDILKMVFEGKMLGDSSKLLKKDDPAKTRGTRAADDMELVSGAEYEVLEAGDIVLTVAAKEAPVTLKSIGVNASGATGIESIRQIDNLQLDNWYDMNGRLLQGKPNRRGMYIHKGQKLVIK